MWPRDLITFATITSTLTAGVATAASVGLDFGDYEVLSDTDERSDNDGKISLFVCFRDGFSRIDAESGLSWQSFFSCLSLILGLSGEARQHTLPRSLALK